MSVAGGPDDGETPAEQLWQNASVPRHEERGQKVPETLLSMMFEPTSKILCTRDTPILNLTHVAGVTAHFQGAPRRPQTCFPRRRNAVQYACGRAVFPNSPCSCPAPARVAGGAMRIRTILVILFWLQVCNATPAYIHNQTKNKM